MPSACINRAYQANSMIYPNELTHSYSEFSQSNKSEDTGSEEPVPHWSWLILQIKSGSVLVNTWIEH